MISLDLILCYCYLTLCYLSLRVNPYTFFFKMNMLLGPELAWLSGSTLACGTEFDTTRDQITLPDPLLLALGDVRQACMLQLHSCTVYTPIGEKKLVWHQK